MKKSAYLEATTKVGNARNIHDILAEHHPDIESTLNRIYRIVSEPLTVAVMGEFSAGKSSFLNKLLKIDTLPVSVLPKTATVNRLVYGTSAKVEIEYLTDQKTIIQSSDGYEAFKALQNAAKLNDPFFLKEIEQIQEVRVFIDNSMLKTFSLLDTPGFNHDDQMDERSLKALGETDLVVWITDATAAAKKTEFEKLSIIKSHVPNLHLVINKGDINADDDNVHRQMLSELKQHFDTINFMDYFSNKDDVHLISSKTWEKETRREEIPPVSNKQKVSKFIAKFCSCIKYEPKFKITKIKNPDEILWDGYFLQYHAGLKETVLNKDQDISLKLIDEQWESLGRQILNEIDIYHALSESVSKFDMANQSSKIYEQHQDRVLRELSISLDNLLTNLFNHCKASHRFFQSKILSSNALVMDFTKLPLYISFQELITNYNIYITRIACEVVASRRAGLEAFLVKIPGSHVTLRDTTHRLIGYWLLRENESGYKLEGRLPAVSHTLDLLDQMGLSLWNGNRFNVDWPQSIHDESCNKLDSSMSFREYVKMKIDEALLSDFQSDINFIINDQAVKSLLSKASQVCNDSIARLTEAQKVFK